MCGNRNGRLAHLRWRSARRGLLAAERRAEVYREEKSGSVHTDPDQHTTALVRKVKQETNEHTDMTDFQKMLIVSSLTHRKTMQNV